MYFYVDIKSSILHRFCIDFIIIFANYANSMYSKLCKIYVANEKKSREINLHRNYIAIT